MEQNQPPFKGYQWIVDSNAFVTETNRDFMKSNMVKFVLEYREASGENYLINIPITINGESFNYYIAEDLNDSNKRYCTNINETKEKEYLNINRQLLSNTYPNSNIFIITSDTNGLHLYINGLPYYSTKLPYSIAVENIFEDSYIGYYDGQDIGNNYNGVLLSVHVFSECCEDSKVWKLFNDVKTELYTPTEPVDTTPIPTKLIVTRYPNTY